ncbi:MAG: magnesium chelatase subunit D family protein [Massilia sp.]|nr:magnesium chelatase subunit D family protein [Massilia sp.]
MIHFPFSAIVGQAQLKTALLLCAVDPSLGGVLIRGDKGTAKSTAARALTDVLPSIARVPGCAFNCAPGAPCVHCETCVAPDATAQLFPVPFITLPLGATEDRVLGTLDLARALAGAGRVFQAGLLASAHRGILYIDEVNLLADHLVDVLLDVAAMGVNSVQREGLSIQHPARFTLIGTMNLEEGDLRPQLLDRFGLMVEVTAPREKTLRADVVRRRIAFESDPAAYVAAWAEPQAALQNRLADAQRLLAHVVLDDALLDLISHLCCEFDVASLRADIVMHKTARAIAALDARTTVTANDVRGAAELVLPHRRRRTPFEQPGLDSERLDKVMEQAGHGPQQEADAPSDAPSSDDLEQESAEQENTPSAPSQSEAPQQVFSVAPGATARPIALDASPLGIVAGRRSKAYDASTGRVVRAVPDEQPGSLALGATLRSAALRDPQHFQVTQSDLHQQIRVGKSANLILFVVDASGSMAAQSRMEAVKGAVLALLTDVYQRRDEVAVIAFRGTSAQVLLAPTRSVERAEQALRSLPTGGRTPLPHALQLALETLQQASANAPPLLVILSDGKANVALDAGAAGSDPWRDTLALAALLAERAVPALVFDTESGYLRLGRASQLAHALGAQCLTLEQLSADNLALTIRASLRT